ncbi:hypothetical protein HPB49_025792 [Dermacentor silvarum]|nr:hypothetical protein HPB49_025792 [Dermacentor silvarum]
MQTEKKTREGPSNTLLDILASKKKKLTQKDHTEQKTQLSAAQEEVARLSSTVKHQEEELQELRALNRELQQKLLHSMDCMQGKHMQLVICKFGLKGSFFLPFNKCIASIFSSCWVLCKLVICILLQTDTGSGIRIASSAWRRIQDNPKDSMFVKDLLTAVWSPAELLGRSLHGKHCPRFPDHPRKVPLSPLKVSVIRECYKERLHKKGLVADMMPGALKQMNHFIVKKISEIERMAKRLQAV